MPLVFLAIKAMKRRAFKSSARKAITNTLLHEDFLAIWGISMSGLACTPFTVTPAPGVMHKELNMTPPPSIPAPHPAGALPALRDAPAEPERKRHRATPASSSHTPPVQTAPQQQLPSPPAPVGKGSSESGKGRVRQRKRTAGVEALERVFAPLVSRNDAIGIQRKIESLHRGTPQDKSAVRAFIGIYCRHCLVGGRGMQEHSRAQCQSFGNRPSLPCPTCALVGVHEYHWPEECSR